MWTSERCVGRLGNLGVCQLSLWGPLGEGLQGSQGSRFLVKETVAPVVCTGDCAPLSEGVGGSDLPLLDCELLEGRDRGLKTKD